MQGLNVSRYVLHWFFTLLLGLPVAEARQFDMVAEIPVPRLPYVEFLNEGSLIAIADKNISIYSKDDFKLLSKSPLEEDFFFTKLMRGKLKNVLILGGLDKKLLRSGNTDAFIMQSMQFYVYSVDTNELKLLDGPHLPGGTKILETSEVDLAPNATLFGYLYGKESGNYCIQKLVDFRIGDSSEDKVLVDMTQLRAGKQSMTDFNLVTRTKTHIWFLSNNKLYSADILSHRAEVKFDFESSDDRVQQIGESEFIVCSSDGQVFQVIVDGPDATVKPIFKRLPNDELHWIRKGEIIAIRGNMMINSPAEVYKYDAASGSAEFIWRTKSSFERFYSNGLDMFGVYDRSGVLTFFRSTGK